MEQKIIDKINTTRDFSFLKTEPPQVTGNKNIIRTAILHDGMALQFASKELKNDKEIVKLAVTNNGASLVYASKELKNDKDIVMTAMEQNPISLNYVGENPELWRSLLDETGLGTYDNFPIRVKQNEEIMLYLLIHSKYKSDIRLDRSINMSRIVSQLATHISPVEILKIIINGRDESSVKFSIGGKLIDASFLLSGGSISIQSEIIEDKSCIDVDIDDFHHLIKLNDYYYEIPQRFCPMISHNDFFIVLDVISFIYKYETHLQDASTKVTPKKCKLSKNIYALANGSIERGRRKGFDYWSGTFYDSYGFKNDRYNETMQELQPMLLDDFDKELYAILSHINNDTNLGLNMPAITMQDCAKLIIHFCEIKMGDIYVDFIDDFNTKLYRKIHVEKKVSNLFIKPASTKRYDIEFIGDMTFNITISGGKKSKKKSKKRGTKRKIV